MFVGVSDIRATLWNQQASAADLKQLAILKQYKIYVEMADRVSARRSLTNTFFLTLNAATFAGTGALIRDPHQVSAWFLAFSLLALLVRCPVWYFFVRSYWQLNSAKYTVVGVLEERLPSSPYWSAEALGEGKDNAKYSPLTHLGQRIPTLFAATYIATFIAVVAS